MLGSVTPTRTGFPGTGLVIKSLNTLSDFASDPWLRLSCG